MEASTHSSTRGSYISRLLNITQLRAFHSLLLKHMYTAPTLVQSIPEQDIQPPSVKPSLQKMDFPNLQRDIPKWKKWLKECFSEEWDRFLKEPFPTSSTEWKLPQLLARRYGSIKHSDEGQPAPEDFTYLNPAKSVVSVPNFRSALTLYYAYVNFNSSSHHRYDPT